MRAIAPSLFQPWLVKRWYMDLSNEAFLRQSNRLIWTIGPCPTSMALLAVVSPLPALPDQVLRQEHH